MASNPGTHHRFLGIHYTGGETIESSLKNLQVYQATPAAEPEPVPRPAGSPRHNWTRAELAEWLTAQAGQDPPPLIALSHGFSFPLAYFIENRLTFPWIDWDAFLLDFQTYWPTHQPYTYVEFIEHRTPDRAAARRNDPAWRRRTEERARHPRWVTRFTGQGGVAKATYAGLPWLLYIRRYAKRRPHFWPFDGWRLPEDRAVILEADPACCRHLYPIAHRTRPQHDAYALAAWLRDLAASGDLAKAANPNLDADDRNLAAVEGWIFGVT